MVTTFMRKVCKPFTFITIIITYLILFILSCGINNSVIEKPVAKATEVLEQTTRPQWEMEWERTIQAAKKEGRVVIYAGFGPDLREAFAKALQKYGIEIEAVLGRGSELSEKILRERKAGIYNVDLYLSGLDTIVNVLKPGGYLAPLEPLLILPEVKDQKLWYKGQLPWADRDKTTLAFDAYLDQGIHINTDIVKPSDITSMQDLLSSRWKEKIIMEDPTVPGRGNNWMTVVAIRLGEDYLKQLAAQKPVLTRDRRQLIDWVAKGRTPVGIGVYPDSYQEYKRAGAPVNNLTHKEVSYLLAGVGHMAYMDKSPHPNASRVFVNWILSREGQELWQQMRNTQSARIDTSIEHLKKSGDPIRQPDMDYYDVRNEAWELDTRAKFNKIVRDVFSPLIR